MTPEVGRLSGAEYTEATLFEELLFGGSRRRDKCFGTRHGEKSGGFFGFFRRQRYSRSIADGRTGLQAVGQGVPCSLFPLRRKACTSDMPLFRGRGNDGYEFDRLLHGPILLDGRDYIGAIDLVFA